jgi:large subunit ribosomal protein L6
LHGVTVSLEETTVTVAIDTDEKKNLWGLTRTLIQNMVTGVSDGYTIKLHIL